MKPDQPPHDSVSPASLVDYESSFAPARRYDTFWPRFGAAVVDGIILMPLSLLDVWIFGSVTKPVLLALWFIFYSFTYIIYSVTLHGLYGQTLGKMITGVRVVDLSETRLSFRQAFLRDSVLVIFTATGIAIDFGTVLRGENPLAGDTFTVASIFISLAAVVWIVAELVTMLWSDKRRAVHDFIARSVVVRTR